MKNPGMENIEGSWDEGPYAILAGQLRPECEKGINGK